LTVEPNQLPTTLSQERNTFPELADELAKFEREIDSEKARIKRKIRDLKKALERYENFEQNARDWILEQMTLNGVVKMESPDRSILYSVVKTPAKVEIDDRALIPEKFVRSEVITKVVTGLDKRAVKRALAAGKEVPGVHLSQRRRLAVSYQDEKAKK
jgi:hypothetical protein